MDDRIGAAAEASARPAGVVVLAVGLGLAWMLLELALSFASGRILVPADLLDRFLFLLPWQLGLFAVIGVAAAVLTRVCGLSLAAAGWLVLGAGSFVFLGGAVGEGLLRKKGPLIAVAGVLGVAAGLALACAALAGLRRPMRGAWRRAWPAAAWSGWTVFFVLWMQHSIVAIRKWEPGPSVLVDFLQPAHVAAGMAACLTVWAVGTLGARRRAATAAALAATLGAAPLTAPAAQPARTPEILVILVDTMRFDHLGANVGEEGLTPALDALAAESVLFTRAFSPGNFTKLAMPGIHASLSYNVTSHPLPAEATTLAEHLKDAGYETYGISTNPYITHKFGYQQGFDLFLDPTSTNEFLIEGLLEAIGAMLPGPAYHFGILSSALYYSPATVVRRRGLEFFDASEGPTFVYLHTMDPHGPYLPPRGHLPEGFDFEDFSSYFDFDALKGKGVLNTPTYRPRLENLKQRYRGEVRFTDQELGELIAELKRRGRWDEMLVWMLSDHGEAFGERDWAGHSGDNVGRVVTQVPLLVKPPRSWGIEPRVEDVLVSTYDILPTTLSLLGLPAPDPAFGRDLAPLLRGEARDPDRVVVSIGPSGLYTVVQWPWKLDVHVSPEEEPSVVSLHHLERDPRETEDVAGAHPEVVSTLEQALAAWRERERSLAMEGGGGEMDALTREQLRELGYVE